MTRAGVQYVTGRDPITTEELYVPSGARERKVQKALVRWKAPESRPLVEEALREAGREDLLPRFRHFAGQAQRRAKGRAGGKGRKPAPAELDTCG